MLSNEEKQARAGRFTASGINRLMGIKGLGKTGETYAFEKAVEIVYGIDDEETFTSFHIDRGNELEPFAFDYKKRQLALEFKELRPSKFYEYNLNGGATPDGEIGDNEGLEIKCPEHKKFFRLQIGGNKLIDKLYYDQMQKQMMSAGWERVHFFNYLQFKGKEFGFTLYVEKDEERCSLIDERIRQAVLVRDSFVEQLVQRSFMQSRIT